jgi:hypothetical protein
MILLLLACFQEIPPTEKGQVFDGTGLLSLYLDGDGFTGPVLNAGSHFVWPHDSIHTVNCGIFTEAASLPFYSQNNVRFWLTVGTRFRLNCTDENVKTLLTLLTEEQRKDSHNLYKMYVEGMVTTALQNQLAQCPFNDITVQWTSLMESARNEIQIRAQTQPHIILEEISVTR